MRGCIALFFTGGAVEGSMSFHTVDKEMCSGKQVGL